MTSHNAHGVDIHGPNSPSTTFLDELSAFMEVPPLPTEASSYLEELLTTSSEAVPSFFPTIQQTTLPPCPSPLVAARRLELEDNYERKKKRAKINRQDLNTRFLQLMDILHIQEDRKVNRAKVLETAIERIRKLQTELAATQVLLRDATRVTTSRPPTASPLVFPSPNPLLQWPMPMTFMPTPLPPRNTRVPATRKAVGPIRLKRARAPSLHGPSSSFLYVAHIVPSILEFCDVWSLLCLMETNRELRNVSRQDRLWKGLMTQRWGSDPSPSIQSIRTSTLSCQQLYQHAHQHNVMPYTNSFSLKYPHATCLAAGQTSRIGVWVFLAQRSNHRTTRTVLTTDGRVLVRQVVELLVVLQNVRSSETVRLSANPVLQIQTVAGTTLLCQTASCEMGGHLAPTLNKWLPCQQQYEDVKEMTLLHHDSCVWRLYVECPGQEMEDEFVQSVQSVMIECLLMQKNKMQTIRVIAHADKSMMKQ